MTESQTVENNNYLTQPIGKLFLTTALPIIMIMVVNGLFNLVDAYFLGIFVGSAALTAVTVMFPVQMLIYSLTTMISNGFASIVARRLGANDLRGAADSFAVAIVMGIAVSAVLMLVFLVFGHQLVAWVTDGDPELTRMAWTYMSIMMFTSPLIFILSVQFDALRSEGKMGFMTLVSVGVTLLNMVFNYIFIVMLDMGVAGSAWGTVAAQLCSLSAIMIYRLRGFSKLGFHLPNMATFVRVAKENLALGAPLSLNYLSISLIAGSVVALLKIYGSDDYTVTVGAYGIITRLMTFSFMPLLGISMAFQSIAGNNFGGKLPARVNVSTKTALIVALVYCVIIEVVFISFAGPIAGSFVKDADMIAETARVLPYVMIMYFTAGPAIILSGFFQAIGDAKRAAILSLSRNYLIGLPLLFTVPRFLGESGIWIAAPIGDIIMVGLTIAVLAIVQKRKGYRGGVFLPVPA
ncbi:MATE family efflux transporter [Maritalea porphyrae]|uniref:MATE family efflux transporter n=1 Tax=Maritalea porphyrae TaxID=880732 RepID=UPI0022B03569|nr:MATE family efflux transporter [Maritalea porphyrae]MCZ4272824.1 MATE family efflux transporter [Maritalea porphyrae]